MKNKIENSLIYLLMICSFKIYGQIDSTKNKSLSSLHMGFGSLSYIGDLRKNNENPLSYLSPSYSIGLEQSLFKNTSININITKGSIQYSQRETNSNLNFRSTIGLIDFNIKYYFDKDFSRKTNPFIIPYISIGLGHLSFRPMADLKDKNGEIYHYWSDGTIRNIEEKEENETNSKILVRDYKYETTLTDPISNYKKTAFSVPIVLGIKLKLTPRIETSLGIGYSLLRTDFLDNNNESKGNDRIFNSNISMNFNFGVKKTNDKIESDDRDLSHLEIQDNDQDGVTDMKDDCPNTPFNIKVNTRGCPIDTDQDGVPDYIDKEPNSGRNKIINSEGISITEAAILEKYTKDTTVEYKINFERIEVKDSNFEEVLKKLKQKEKNSQNSDIKSLIIPEELKAIDFDNDGQIKANEIMKAIDYYFDEDQRITIEKINLLIEHFFNN